MSQPAGGRQRGPPRHVTIPHLVGRHVTIPATRNPQYFEPPEKRGSSLARSCNRVERTGTLQGCNLEVNTVGLKYWDPKEENGGPNREEREEKYYVSNSAASP